jgi:hypothetical protein
MHRLKRLEPTVAAVLVLTAGMKASAISFRFISAAVLTVVALATICTILLNAAA